jgi:hypothetical protein
MFTLRSSMSHLAAPPLLADPGDPAVAGAETPRGLIVGQIGILGRLAEAGLAIALSVEQRATAAPDADLGDVALAYGRASRAVRLTLALQSALLKDLQALDETAARRVLGEAANAERAQKTQEAIRRIRVERVVGRLIQAETGDAAEVDRLAGEARERLEDDDIYGDLSERSFGEIVALVCRDLGLAPDWSCWAQEAWMQDPAPGGAGRSSPAPPRWRDPPHPGPAAGPAPVRLRGASP